VASVIRCQKLPICPIEPVPGGSQTDPLLATVEPISNGGSASGITYLRRGKNLVEWQLQWERGVRTCERNNSADIKVSAGEGGGAPDAGAGVPLQPVEQTLVRQADPAALEAHGGADPHPQPGEDPTLEQGMPEGGSDPMGSPRWSRLLPGAVAPWREEPMLEQVCWQGL